MAGLLGLHFEDASGEERRVATEPGGLDESETATAAVEEVVTESAEVAEADAEAEDMGERVELAEELHDTVEPVVTEGAGLDRAGMALLLTGMRRVAGKHGKHLVGLDVRMEAISAGVSGRREQTRIQFESIKDTLKQAWEAIKAAFKKAWAKVKTWYIKTFDASKKLKKRAESIRNRAETSNATIDKKSFSFSGSKSIAIDGKVKDGGAFVTALGQIEKLAGDVLDVKKTDDVGKVAEKLGEKLGDVDGKGLSDAIDTLYQEVLKSVKVVGLSGTVSDPKVKASFGEASEVTLAASSELPGGKIIVNVTGKGGSTDVAARIAGIRRARTLMLKTSNVT